MVSVTSVTKGPSTMTGGVVSGAGSVKNVRMALVVGPFPASSEAETWTEYCVAAESPVRVMVWLSARAASDTDSPV